MMFQTLHILLFLTAVAMITERVTAACLKMKLKEFRNRYNTVQRWKYRRWKYRYLKPSCCEFDQEFGLAQTSQEIYNRRDLKRFCPDSNVCDHTINVYHAVNGVKGSTGWAGTEFEGHTTFGNWIGDINNNNIRACSELQRKVYSDNTPGGQQRREEWVMPDVDVSINVNDFDLWPNDNDYVTHFKARIHPMRFASGKQTLCLYANYMHEDWRMTYRPDQGCTEAPYWIKIDFEMETTAEEKRKLSNQSRDTSATTGPFCTIVENNLVYGCRPWG